MDKEEPTKNNTQEVWKTRLEICKQCPYFFGFTGQCTQCACYMRIKVRISDSVCPVGKW